MSTTEARPGVAAALLLRRWWSRPTAAERETWDGLWDEAGAAAQSLGLGESDTDELRVAAAAMGASAEAASAVYRRLGVDVREDAHQLPDHLPLECEALAYALAHAALRE